MKNDHCADKFESLSLSLYIYVNIKKEYVSWIDEQFTLQTLSIVVWSRDFIAIINGKLKEKTIVFDTGEYFIMLFRKSVLSGNTFFRIKIDFRAAEAINQLKKGSHFNFNLLCCYQ